MSLKLCMTSRGMAGDRHPVVGRNRFPPEIRRSFQFQTWGGSVGLEILPPARISSTSEPSSTSTASDFETEDGRLGDPGQGGDPNPAPVADGDGQRLSRPRRHRARTTPDRHQEPRQGLHLRLRLRTGTWLFTTCPQLSYWSSFVLFENKRLAFRLSNLLFETLL